MLTLEKLKKLEESGIKKIEEFAINYPNDIGRLYNSYKILQTQSRWSKEFLDGYLSTINDLILIKQGHWGY